MERLLIFIFLALSQPYGFADTQQISPSFYCPDAHQPILFYSALYTDTGSVESRINQIWIDKSEDEVRGFWLEKNSDSKFLLGKEVSKDRFLTCLYTQGQKKPFRALMLDFNAGAIRLSNLNTLDTHALILKSITGMAENRTYTLKNVNNSIAHLLPNRPADALCESKLSTIRLIKEKQPQTFTKINQIISELDEKYFAARNEYVECVKTKNLVRQKVSSTAKMFADDNYISLKIDIFQKFGESGSLSGSSLVYDLKKQRVLKIKDIFEKKFHQSILQLIHEQTKKIYGTEGRLKDLDFVNFSFTPHTAIFSYDALDEQGPYLPLEYVDIPLSLDSLFQNKQVIAKQVFRTP